MIYENVFFLIFVLETRITVFICFYYLMKCGGKGESEHPCYSGIQADGANTVLSVANCHAKGKESNRGGFGSCS